MMIPKGKLLALLLAFTAVGGLAATGAFTTVEAERTATVNVDGDADALLAIEPKNTDTNDFVNQADGTGDSELQIDLSGGDAQALNTDAATNEENIITITNNGQNTVSFFIATEGGLQDGSVGVDGSTPDGGATGDNNVSDNVNVEFYIDDANVTGSVNDPSGENPSAGDVVVDTSNSPVTLNSEVGDGDSSLDTFVDVGSSSPATSTDSDYSISDQGDRSETPDDDASAVELAPGQSVEISIYVEIDVDDSQFDDLSDVSVLENIVIIASEDIDGDLADTGDSA
jgi:hypothetical protein